MFIFFNQAVFLINFFLASQDQHQLPKYFCMHANAVKKKLAN